MSFKLFSNKISTQKKYSRQLQGGTIEVKKNSLGWWDRRTDFNRIAIDDIVLVVTRDFEYRPDKVAAAAYGRDDLEWVILQYNNIVDVIEEMAVGKIIIIPSKIRVFNQIITKTVKYRPI